MRRTPSPWGGAGAGGDRGLVIGGHLFPPRGWLRRGREANQREVGSTRRADATSLGVKSTGKDSLSVRIFVISRFYRRVETSRHCQLVLNELLASAFGRNLVELPFGLPRAPSSRPGSPSANTRNPPFPAGLCEADDGVRTRDPQLGKLMLYQLSYVRVPKRVPHPRSNRG
jgi:hypothetical protein